MRETEKKHELKKTPAEHVEVIRDYVDELHRLLTDAAFRKEVGEGR